MSRYLLPLMAGLMLASPLVTLFVIDHAMSGVCVRMNRIV